MAAVGGDPAIFRVEGGLDPRGHRFLAVVQVAKSANVSGLVFVVACDFHSAHGVHEFEVAEEFFLGHGDFVAGGAVESVRFEGAGEVECGGLIGAKEPVCLCLCLRCCYGGIDIDIDIDIDVGHFDHFGQALLTLLEEQGEVSGEGQHYFLNCLIL